MRTSFHHQSEAQPPNGPLTAVTSPDTPSARPASQSVSNGLQMKVAHVIEGIGYGELHARLSLIWNLTGGQKKPIMLIQIFGSWYLAEIIS
jgi:hypothetical protein